MTGNISAAVVVIGEGIAGLVAALRARDAGASVLIVGLGGGASGWLQGVNVVVDGADNQDTTSAHRDDILREGCGINIPTMVEDTVSAAQQAFRALRELGVGFAEVDGKLVLRHASGSSRPRCCFTPSAMWGGQAATILRRALKTRSVQRKRLRVLRLIVNGGRVRGVVAQDPRGGNPVMIDAGAVILASGGVGSLFAQSTYPRDVYGASAALALRAGAELADMEFLQFEPLVGHAPKEISRYVIPTTLFGDGAVMRDVNGRRFLLERRPQGEAGIGKEDLVREMARQSAAGTTLKEGGLWFDATGLDPSIIDRYPWLATFMRKHEIDMTQSPVAVWPAPHTCLGGVAVDRDRQSRVGGLFAAGEAAAGVHGAGRLAGGSGTDVLAAGWIAGAAAARVAAATRFGTMPTSLNYNICSPADADGRALTQVNAEVSQCLSNAAGIVRNGETLADAANQLARLAEGLGASSENPLSPAAATADRILVGRAIIESALARCESRGAHLRSDYPATDALQARSLFVSFDGDGDGNVAIVTERRT
ncbi:FAD-binding protein [Silicimonas algicola]|uniref:L-aspartate oxidase n=1 Tax=Silicimonas algicola TaxID=1826607 RepID=A0A316G9K7_9RHOB|nr:FAD-binding protein [Silicimonas algicola]AZQ67959.1 FAD-binding protein [Silicimonas algicola]PWK57601.1 succinate dehydrogenase / fumarate reductase flavoprotein subunit [Silicimonas algicola]